MHSNKVEVSHGEVDEIWAEDDKQELVFQQEVQVDSKVLDSQYHDVVDTQVQVHEVQLVEAQEEVDGIKEKDGKR